MEWKYIFHVAPFHNFCKCWLGGAWRKMLFVTSFQLWFYHHSLKSHENVMVWEQSICCYKVYTSFCAHLSAHFSMITYILLWYLRCYYVFGNKGSKLVVAKRISITSVRHDLLTLLFKKTHHDCLYDKCPWKVYRPFFYFCILFFLSRFALEQFSLSDGIFILNFPS